MNARSGSEGRAATGARDPSPDTQRSESQEDLRFGHDLGAVQDANGTDLLLLKSHLSLTVEQRLRSLEVRSQFMSQVRRVPRKL